MADAIEFALEDCLADTWAQVDAGLLARAEAQEAMRRRRAFEVAWQSTAAVGAGDSVAAYRLRVFRDYIQYEEALATLLALRLGRRAAVGRKRRRDGGERRLPVNRLTGRWQRRVLALYERAVRCRWLRGDESLWLGYARYALQAGSVSICRRVLSRALSAIGARSCRVYAVAGAVEADVRGSVSTARALFQRGLRAHAQQPEMWAQYFAFELAFALRLHKRRQVLLADAHEAVRLQVPLLVLQHGVQQLASGGARQQFVQRCRELMPSVAADAAAVQSVLSERLEQWERTGGSDCI